MRVLVTVPHMAKESTGPSYTVPSLCRCLMHEGVDIQLHTLAKPENARYDYPVIVYPQRTEWPLRRLGWSREMAQGLKRITPEFDIVYINGVWLLPNIYSSMAAHGTGCKVICCPRGGLSPVTLRRRRLVKWLMWRCGGQERALQGVAMFHAASEKEYREIRALGFQQPVAIIPNGVDVPDIRHRLFDEHDRKLVFFGRIHSTKAADHLVEAWSRVAADFPDWSLEIAGPDCGAVPQLMAMIARQNIPRVSLVGEFHGMDKYRYLAMADLYVLPSLTENFGITVAEALACGTPVIASKGCPWKRIVEKGCGWWIDIGPDALAKTLREVLSLPPSALDNMGRIGRSWMSKEYTWQGVAKTMVTAYEWLLHGGQKPDCVRL